MNIFAVILVGLIAGWLASKIMKTNTSLFAELLLGIAGGIVGGWIYQLITGTKLFGEFNLWSIIVSLLGAILVIVIFRLIKRR